MKTREKVKKLKLFDVELAKTFGWLIKLSFKHARGSSVAYALASLVNMPYSGVIKVKECSRTRLTGF